MIRLFEPGELAQRPGGDAVPVRRPTPAAARRRPPAKAAASGAPPAAGTPAGPPAAGDADGPGRRRRRTAPPATRAGRAPVPARRAPRRRRCGACSTGSTPSSAPRPEIADGPLLIIAGPGTGKTRTLTHRIAHLVADRGVPAEQCLAITFTRRAAEEMAERLAALAAGHAPRLTTPPSTRWRCASCASSTSGRASARGSASPTSAARLALARRADRRRAGGPPPAARGLGAAARRRGGRGRSRTPSSPSGTPRRCASTTWSTSTT